MKYTEYSNKVFYVCVTQVSYQGCLIWSCFHNVGQHMRFRYLPRMAVSYKQAQKTNYPVKNFSVQINYSYQYNNGYNTIENRFLLPTKMTLIFWICETKREPQKQFPSLSLNGMTGLAIRAKIVLITKLWICEYCRCLFLYSHLVCNV